MQYISGAFCKWVFAYTNVGHLNVNSSGHWYWSEEVVTTGQQDFLVIWWHCLNCKDYSVLSGCKDDNECSFMRIWKETVLGYFKVLSQHFPKETKDNHHKHQSGKTWIYVYSITTIPTCLVGEWLQADKSEKYIALITVYLLTIWRNFLPGIWWIHERRVLNLFIDVFILIEGKGPTKANIHNNTNAPHIQRAIVTLITKNLGGCATGDIT